MSHELRTPLNAIIGFSEILADDRLMPLTPARRTEYAGLIRRSGEHVLEVVNSVLDVSRIEAGAFAIARESCDAGTTVSQSAALMALRAEAAGVELRCSVAPDLPPIMADRRALTQVALNLIANAIKFTPRGGDVSVLVRRAGGGVSIMVRDTGVGVASEHLARLGEPFFQVDDAEGRARDGAGLGLSVVRGLVELHGGEFAIESASGAGTRVTVTLPADGRRAGPAESDARVARPAFRRAEPAAPSYEPEVRRSA
jgi:cell cycle sensor histidine kinase DivJ